MGLLGDIQSAIIDADRPLPAALRMAMVLAARLDNQLLRQWVDRELNGYLDDAELPIGPSARLGCSAISAARWACRPTASRSLRSKSRPNTET